MTPLLTLTQWLSPGFPTGAFAYSHGLEQVIADGAVNDASTLELWLSDVLRYGAGWQDGVLLVQALDAGADHDALDGLARALQPSAERLQETLEQGAAFARTVAAISGLALPPRALPVAVGEAAAPLHLPREQVAALFLQAFAGNLVTIAVRHVPLGQTEGQRVLARLAPLMAGLARQAAEATLDALASAALATDLASIRHETKETRLFRT